MNGYSVGLLMMWIFTLGGLMLSVDNITGYHWSPNLWNHLLHDTLRTGLGMFTVFYWYKIKDQPNCEIPNPE
jgi:hypothetical protein